MSQFWTSVLDFCNTTVVRVGDQLLAELDTARASRKADGSLVTQLDIWADETLRTDIAVTFPDHGVLSEEAEHVFPGTEWCWVIDPIDGTTNFVRGIPLWAISLGLLYHGTPVFGYVHVPPLNQSFYGYRLADVGIEDPVGAYCNGKRIHTSPDALSRNHFLSICSRSTGILQQSRPCKVRMLGVAAYNLVTVATGAVLGAIEATPKVWDIAGAWPIVHAAGGEWVALDDQTAFPLAPGQDYTTKSFPTLAVARRKLADDFEPLAKSALGA